MVITSVCSTAIESLSLYIEHVLYKLSENIHSRIKDGNHLLDITGNVNITDLPMNTILVSFDIVIMFPSIDSKSGLDVVKSVLLNMSTNISPAACILALNFV